MNKEERNAIIGSKLVELAERIQILKPSRKQLNDSSFQFREIAGLIDELIGGKKTDAILWGKEVTSEKQVSEAMSQKYSAKERSKYLVIPLKGAGIDIHAICATLVQLDE